MWLLLRRPTDRIAAAATDAGAPSMDMESLARPAALASHPGPSGGSLLKETRRRLLQPAVHPKHLVEHQCPSPAARSSPPPPHPPPPPLVGASDLHPVQFVNDAANFKLAWNRSTYSMNSLPEDVLSLLQAWILFLKVGLLLSVKKGSVCFYCTMLRCTEQGLNYQR
ncbi:unnamed protein product [Urochloa humidicola]